MGNDIEIRVRVANNTAAGLTAVNRSLNQLRDEARDAGRGLDGLAARAGVAAASLRALKDSAQDAARALRSLNTAARNADGRLDTMSQRSRTLRRDTDELDGSMRRLTTTMGGLRGGSGNLRVSLNDNSRGMDNLRKAALLLSPALIPIAAATVPIAASLTAAGVAVGAFGLALGGQVAEMAKASDAEKKYNEAVKEHGRSSDEAAKAEAKYLAAVRDMDPATRRAAAAFTVFKDSYKDWSKSLAGDTMPVVTKGLATFGALLPRLTPMVKGASGELDRFMTILAGGVNSGGFSAFMNTFSTFATGALARANDGLVRFMRTMSGGAGSSQFTEFMQYAHRVGPQVGETLGNLARALTHVVAAASETGVSLLTAVNAFAKLVNAIPTGTLSNLLQFVVVFKAVKIAALGLGGAGGAVSGFVASLAAMRAASAAAGGGLAGLSAAFGALSRATKVALIGSGIGILVVALSELSQMGKKTPPDVDKLTTSLKGLAETGKNTGESAKAWGTNFEGLSESLSRLDPKGFDGFLQGWAEFLGTDSTQVKTAKEDIDSLDKSLADLVKGGKADVAAKALEGLKKKLGPKAFKELTANIDNYKAALADQALEAKFTAESMGVFGQAAQDTSAKLNAQKQSADALRQSLQALNDVQRQGLGGMIGFEAAIDAAAKAAQENAGALSMTHGQLDLNSEKARSAATALQDLASKTDEAAAAARESGSSWETVNGIYSRGRAALIKNAEAMGLSKTEAAALADQILRIPDKTAKFKMDTEDARAGLEAFNAAVKRSPNSKSVTLKTLSTGAMEALEAFGFKVKRLPNGKVKVTTQNGQALSAIASVAGALNRLNGKKAVTWTYHNIKTTHINETIYHTKGSLHGVVGATGGLLSALPVQRLATGGEVQAGPNGLISGPGSGTSDSILAMFNSGVMGRISNTEFVVNAASTRKYLPLLEAINNNQLKLPGFAKGGKLTKRQKAAAAQHKAEQEARREATGDLTISHFGQIAGYKRSEFRSALAKPDSIGSLVDSLNHWASVIKKATHGGVEKGLLKALDSTGKRLLAYDRQLNKVTASLEKAKDKLDNLKQAAAQLADNVKSGILGSANITRGAQGEGPVTVKSIMAGLTQSRDKATSFDKALKELQKKGLNKDLLQQIAEAGIEGGGLETATALLGASSSEIKSMNSLQGQIGKAASSAGKTTADAVYKDAIAKQAGIVKGLTQQQEKLMKAMDRLAASMEKLIEKAFKKKAAGGIVGAAASGGMRGGLTMVGEQGFELLDLPAGTRVWSNPDSRRKLGEQAPWASMLNEPRRATSRAAVAASPAGGRVVYELVVNLDGRTVARQIIDPLRAEIAHRGGSVQKSLGQGAG